jgi:hypothetical protein
MWQAWVNLIAGIWLIVGGIIPSLQSDTSLIVPGIVVAVFGFWSGKWQGIINGIMGILLILNAAMYYFSTGWVYIIFGIIILVMSIWSLMPNSGMTGEVK